MADERLGVLQILLCGLGVVALGVAVHADQAHMGALPRLHPSKWACDAPVREKRTCATRQGALLTGDRSLTTLNLLKL